MPCWSLPSTKASTLSTVHARKGLENYQKVFSRLYSFTHRVRRMGLEFIVVIAEKAGTMLRKRAKIVESTLPIALSIIVEGTDDDDWATGVRAASTA